MSDVEGAKKSRTEAIDGRYGALAESGCCLSCGGAVYHGEASAGEVCADLGSGRGTDVLRLADEVGAEGFVYGIDLSEGMLEKARRTAERLGVRNVAFIRAELESIPLESGSVDLVVSNCAINHAADKQRVWNEIHRILRPGGRFAVSDIYALEDVPPQYAADPQAVAECWAGAVTREEYLAALERAGLSGVEILEESAPYQKGAIRVASFTVGGFKPAGGCCCGS
jgi:SAM-dependent methyltransferase